MQYIHADTGASGLRRLGAALLTAACTLAAATPALASTFPDRPVTLVVGFAPGGQTDNIARMVATRLGEALGQTVVVHNRAGAASTIAYRSVAEAAPDGYTLMFGGTSAHAIAPVLTQVPYDAVKDFRAVGKVSTLPLSISVHPGVPANDLGELIELIRQDPKAFSYATGGAGGIEHLTGEIFKQVADTPDLLHVPFKGGAPAATAVIGGQIPILINPLSTVFPYADAGQLRVLAVASAERLAADPELPTAIESGLENFIAEGFNVLLVPSGTPDEIVATLNDGLRTVMADPEFVAQLLAMKVNPQEASTPAQTDAYLREEVDRWAEVIATADVSVD